MADPRTISIAKVKNAMSEAKEELLTSEFHDVWCVDVIKLATEVYIRHVEQKLFKKEETTDAEN